MESLNIAVTNFILKKVSTHKGGREIAFDSTEKKEAYSIKKGRIIKIETPTPHFTFNNEIGFRFVNEYLQHLLAIKDKKEIAALFLVEMELISIKFYEEWLELLANEIDVDPILNAQDYLEYGYRVKELNTKTGEVTLEGVENEEFIIHLQLVLENEKIVVGGCGIVNMPKK